MSFYYIRIDTAGAGNVSLKTCGEIFLVILNIVWQAWGAVMCTIYYCKCSPKQPNTEKKDLYSNEEENDQLLPKKREKNAIKREKLKPLEA